MFWERHFTEYSLGQFIYNNYRQALEIINTNPGFISAACATLGVREDDFETFLEEEKTYLQDLRRGPAAPHLDIEYVAALEELVKRQ